MKNQKNAVPTYVYNATLAYEHSRKTFYTILVADGKRLSYVYYIIKNPLVFY